LSWKSGKGWEAQETHTRKKLKNSTIKREKNIATLQTVSHPTRNMEYPSNILKRVFTLLNTIPKKDSWETIYGYYTRRKKKNAKLPPLKNPWESL
jgi:hypothetical protein